MKILQVSKFYHPFLGGIETVVRYLSEGLIDEGFKVSVLCFSNTIKKIEISSMNGVELLRAPILTNISSQPLSWQYVRTLRNLANQFDVVHFHSPNPLAEVASLTWSTRSARVVTYHAEVTRQKNLLPIYNWFLHHFLNQTDQIVVSSTVMLEQASYLKKHKKKCQVIPFGIPNNHSTDLELKNRVQKLHTRYGNFILFVGRWVSYKGLSYLIEAMNHIKQHKPQVKLLLIGDGPIRSHLEAQIQTLQLQNQVHLIGRVESTQELQAYYHACEFLVLPSISKSEAFGMVLLEAMQASKPVITTKIQSGVIEVNQEGVTGLQVETKNSSALSLAILELLDQPELQRKMGENAKKRVENHYSQTQMVKNYSNLYKLVNFSRKRNS